jgi:hypothetical protein
MSAPPCLASDVDAPFTNAAFAEKNGLNFPILSDYDRKAVRAYGIAHDDFAGLTGYTAAKRSVFVVDGSGTIRYCLGRARTPVSSQTTTKSKPPSPPCAKRLCAPPPPCSAQAVAVADLPQTAPCRD